MAWNDDTIDDAALVTACLVALGGDRLSEALIVQAGARKPARQADDQPTTTQNLA